MRNITPRVLINRLLQFARSGRSSCPAKKPTRKRCLARKLTIEQLEDRTVLSSLVQAVSPLDALLPPSGSTGGASQPKLSADGRYIAFTSAAPTSCRDRSTR